MLPISGAPEKHRAGTRVALRAATAKRHAELDSLFSSLDVTTKSGYVTFLSRLAAAYVPVDAQLEATGIRALFPDWDRRSRRAALLDDLRHLGVATPLMLPALFFATPEDMLGALYVLEGSRLGGQLLLRQVAASFDEEVKAAKRFLQSGEDTGSWRDFLAVLENRAVDEAGLERMITAADRTFALFIAAANVSSPT